MEYFQEHFAVGIFLVVARLWVAVAAKGSEVEGFANGNSVEANLVLASKRVFDTLESKDIQNNDPKTT